MRSFRTPAFLAVAVALIVAAVVAAPAIGDSGAARQNAVPPAEVAGSDAPSLLPSIVNTRLVRAQAALGQATMSYDLNQAGQAVVPMGAAASNVSKAWAAEKYVIKTAPPPPVGDALPDDVEASASAYAGPEDSGFAVLSAQHDVVSASVGMMETGNADLAKSLTSAISSVQNARLTAIKYIHSLPAPPVGDGIGTDGTPVGSTWATVMPGYVAVLGDELQQIKGRLALTKFSAAAKAALTAAQVRAQNTKDLVNQYWPPVPGD